MTLTTDGAAAKSVGPILDPIAGTAFTGSLVHATYTRGGGWGDPVLAPIGTLDMHPAMRGLHYGHIVFEGLKAHRGVDGSVAVFRLDAHARRLRRSARRMVMPEVPERLFRAAVDELVAADHGALSDDPRHSMYLRPLLFGSDANLMFPPADEYRFLMMAMIIGDYFGDHPGAIAVSVCRDQCRAAPGGTGNIKCPGNYAVAIMAQQRAAAAGFQEVVWLDPVERRWLEELSGMNLFLVRSGNGTVEVVTPELTDTILAGVTRDSLLTLAAEAGYRVCEERISIDQWRDGCASGVITEAFAAGTAAVVAPIGRVGDAAGDFTVGDGNAGPVTLALRGALIDLHRGVAPDHADWRHVVSGSPADARR
ncbi:MULTISPECIES: branched-chain amino acid aminotransferase [unclassified Nocardia]|uniref:branched-chain amino acid aminotransferase n=1 Tax=unclassified Nocardia TaxID=2637762 RepID=UPI001CE4B451|nr:MULTISPECIES: branched-chain amino acid aminotransferase [unclassified Nocardia]